MKKTHTIRAGIIMLLFFAFAYARAGFIPVITTTPACQGNDGTVTITGTGVPGPYSFYIYVNGVYQIDSNVASSATFTGLPAGTFQFYAYSNYADQPGTFTITSALGIQLNTTQPVCPASTTGTSTVTVTSGAAPYTYLWSNGQTTATATNLPVGFNSVTVTDNNGCFVRSIDSVQITSSIIAGINHTGSVCSGTLAATATGGNSPYTYIWSNGATSSSITNLLNNTGYYVQVTDALGCNATASTVTFNSGLAFDTIQTHIVQPTCGSNGSISVVMLTGTAPYTYAWSNGLTVANLTGLANGNYNVTTTDANGCTGQHYYYLYGNTLTEYIYGVTNPACGSSNGSIGTYIYGGVQPYTFTWSNTGTNHTNFDSLLSPGTYHVTVADAAGCTIVDSATLIPQGNFSASVAISPIICPATTGGSMTVNVTGAGPYTYLWSNGATTQTVNNVPEATSLSVIATDGGGCQAEAWSDTMSITSSINLTLNSVACNFTVAGVATGGTAPYTYLWSNGATTASISYTLYTYYSLQVSDVTGCSTIQWFYASAPGIAIDSSSNITYPTCSSSGSIEALPLNGVAPYTYIWSNGATTATVTGLSFGSYLVTVTDANGCTGTAYYYLGQNSINVYPNNNSLSCGASNGEITLTVYGGTPPYSYAWSNSANNSYRDTLLPAGNYGFTVTDAGGCSVTGTDQLTGQGAFNVTISTTPTSCNQANPTGAVNVTVSNGGTAPFTFNWQVYNNQQGYTYPVTNSGLSGLAYGTDVWLISVVDANGCTDSTLNYISTDTVGTFINYAPSCFDDITGYVYTDLNGNCIKNTGEPGIQGTIISVLGTNGLNYYANTDSNGFYDVQVLPGTYTISTYTYGNCSPSLCNTTYTPTLTGTGTVSSGNNFGYNNSPSFDLGVHTGFLPSYPGSSKEYWVYYYNSGTSAASNAVLTFVHDANLTLTSTNPPYSSYNAATQTITWNVGTVPVSSLSSNQYVTMFFDVPSSLPLGAALSTTTLITPVSGDCNPADNSEVITDVVTGSHDPNEKEVSPSGNITTSDSVLNYTIRFQNTGNAPATRIVIVDTLSPLVNPATLVFGASSSSYTHTLTGNGIITFTFDPIYLPDSSHGRDSSSGFVNYSVNIRNNDVIGQQVKNTAYIYFDLNPAIVTNTTVSTLSFPAGINHLTAGSMSVSVSPNPMHDKSQFSIQGANGEVSFTIEDVAGQRIFEKATSDTNIIFDSESFAAGIYIYTARDNQGNTCTGKIVIAH